MVDKIDSYAQKYNTILRSEENKNGRKMNKFDVAQYLLSKGILKPDEYNAWIKTNEGITSKEESEKLKKMPVWQIQQAHSPIGYLDSVSEFSIGEVMGLKQSVAKLKSPEQQFEETKLKQHIQSLTKTNKSYNELKYEIDSEKMSKGQKIDAQLKLSSEKFHKALENDDTGKAVGALLEGIGLSLSKIFNTIDEGLGIKSLKKYLRGHVPVILPNGTVTTIDMDKALDKLSKYANDGNPENLSLGETLVAGVKSSVDFADNLIGTELIAYMTVFGAIAKCAQGAKYAKFISNALTGIFTTMGIVDGVQGLTEMSNAKTQKEAESAFNKIYNSLFILGGTGHSFVKGKTNVKAAQKSEGKADGSGYLYSSFWPFKPKKADTKPTEIVKPVETSKTTPKTHFEQNIDNFEPIENSITTQIAHLSREDIGLSIRAGGWRRDIARLSRIEASDIRRSPINDLTYDNYKNGNSVTISYSKKDNTTAITYYANDSGEGTNAIYIPGKISQIDAKAIVDMVRNKFYSPLGWTPIKDKIESADWKAVQQEIANFLNKGGVKTIAPNPTISTPKLSESAPKPFEIPSPKPTVQPFQPKVEPLKPTPAFTPEPAKPVAPPKATEPIPPQSIKKPDDLKFGGLYTTTKIAPKPTTQTGKPFLTESETALMEQHIGYMPEKLKNAIKAGFDDLGAKLQKGDPSPNILQDSCDAIAQKTGLSASMIMMHMKSIMHKFGGKWQIIEFNNINQMYEFILSRK